MKIKKKEEGQAGRLERDLLRLIDEKRSQNEALKKVLQNLGGHSSNKT